MSEVVLAGITKCSPPKERLFAPETPPYFIATSAVVSESAANETQSQKARRLGKRLLVAAGKKDRSWVDEHLQPALFSVNNPTEELRLDASNFEEVAYASSRMLHGWDIPAWIARKPFVDASYTCLCPAIEMVEAGYQEVIAIANEPGTLYRDMFQIEAIPQSYKGVNIHIIKPDVDPKEVGVDFRKATEEGFAAVYQHGQQKGQEFIESGAKVHPFVGG